MQNPIAPTVGRIVLFRSTLEEHIGSSAPEVPEIITRVWSPTCVNLIVFRDGESPFPLTSVCYDDSEGGPSFCGWRWMAYQKAVAGGDVEPARHA